MAQDFALALFVTAVVLGLGVAIFRIFRSALRGDDGRPWNKEDGQGISPFDDNMDTIRHNGRHDGQGFGGGSY